ncbi:MAG: helix-turn-helix transcriptional regulator [Hyphomicrobiales bacterium]
MDRQTSDMLALDVIKDEQAIIEGIVKLRRQSSVSLEAIGYLMGSDPAQISRYLKGVSSITLTNYLRIARSLGYRCKIVLEKDENCGLDINPLAELKLISHKVHNRR